MHRVRAPCEHLHFCWAVPVCQTPFAAQSIIMLHQNVRPFTAQRPSRAARSVACQAVQQPRNRLADASAFASAALVALAPAAQAAQVAAESAAVESVSVPLAVGGGAALAGLGALLVAADPQKR